MVQIWHRISSRVFHFVTLYKLTKYLETVLVFGIFDWFLLFQWFFFCWLKHEPLNTHSCTHTHTLLRLLQTIGGKNARIRKPKDVKKERGRRTWLCTCILVLDGIRYDSCSRLTFTSESPCLPFTFLPPGAVDGDFLATWQYSWASCPGVLYYLTCHLFLFSFLFFPSSLPPPPTRFLSPFCLSCLPVWFGGEQQLGTEKKHATIWNHYSSVTRVL